MLQTQDSRTSGGCQELIGGGIAEISAVAPLSFIRSQQSYLGSQPAEDCNTASGDRLLDVHIQTTEQKRLEAETKRQRRVVSLAARIAKFDKRLADRMANCGRKQYYATTKCSHKHESAKVSFLCGAPLCPRCQRVRSLRLVHRLSNPLAQFQAANGLTASFVTLTFRNTEELPSFAEIVKARRRLFRSKFWRPYGLFGSIGALEDKIGKNSGLWHYHLHMVVFTERPIPLIEHGEQAGNWQLEVNQSLSDAWSVASGGSFIVRGKAFDGNYQEILKYISIGEENDMTDKQLQELCGWLKGRRFLFTTGKLYANKELKALIQAAEEADEHEHGLEACPDCGCREIEVREFEWRPGLNNFVVSRVFDLTLPEIGGDG